MIKGIYKYTQSYSAILPFDNQGKFTCNRNIIMYIVFSFDAIFGPGHLWQIQKELK